MGIKTHNDSLLAGKQNELYFNGYFYNFSHFYMGILLLLSRASGRFLNKQYLDFYLIRKRTYKNLDVTGFEHAPFFLIKYFSFLSIE